MSMYYIGILGSETFLNDIESRELIMSKLQDAHSGGSEAEGLVDMGRGLILPRRLLGREGDQNFRYIHCEASNLEKLTELIKGIGLEDFKYEIKPALNEIKESGIYPEDTVKFTFSYRSGDKMWVDPFEHILAEICLFKELVEALGNTLLNPESKVAEGVINLPVSSFISTWTSHMASEEVYGKIPVSRAEIITDILRANGIEAEVKDGKNKCTVRILPVSREKFFKIVDLVSQTSERISAKFKALMGIDKVEEFLTHEDRKLLALQRHVYKRDRLEISDYFIPETKIRMFIDVNPIGPYPAQNGEGSYLYGGYISVALIDEDNENNLCKSELEKLKAKLEQRFLGEQVEIEESREDWQEESFLVVKYTPKRRLIGAVNVKAVINILTELGWLNDTAPKDILDNLGIESGRKK